MCSFLSVTSSFVLVGYIEHSVQGNRFEVLNCIHHLPACPPMVCIDVLCEVRRESVVEGASWQATATFFSNQWTSFNIFFVNIVFLDRSSVPLAVDRYHKLSIHSCLSW